MNTRPDRSRTGSTRYGLSLVTVFWLVAASPAGAALIEVIPSTSSPGVFERFEVSLAIHDLGELMPPSLGAFDLNLTFDPGLVAFVSESYGDPALGDQLGLFVPSLTFTTPAPGLVNLFQLSFDFPSDLESLQASSFTLVTLQFDAIAAGTMPLLLDAVTLSDAFGGSLDAQVSGSSVTIGGAPGVPEPGTASLILVALGVGAVRRRTSRRPKEAAHGR